MSTSARHSPRDYLPICVSVTVWAFGTPIFKMLQSQACDQYALVFYRTFASALALTVWAWLYAREDLRQALKGLRPFFLLGILFAAGLITFIQGTFASSATISILITRAIPLLTIAFSAIIFIDERRVVRRPLFMIGFLIALSGLLGLCLSRADSGQTQSHASRGIVLLLACAVIWAVYSVCVKAWLAGKQPIVASLLVFWVASFITLPVMLVWGRPGWVLSAPPFWVAVMFASGPAIMGLGESLYYLSIRRIGLGPSTSATLLVPLLTALVAWPLLGERPTLPIIGFGALLLGGLGLIVHARARHVHLASDGVPEPVAGRQGAAAVAAGRVEVEKEYREQIER